ncbi:MAG: ATP-grasp domain-containing protein [Dehalococcoidia bacterium]|nr:ATP-grasp domain-containing protein [Dehalococcoidia bacterium]
MTVPRVLLLIPNASYRAPDFLQAAAALGVDVVVGSDQRSPLENLHPDRQVGLDYADPDHGADQIEAYARRYSLDCIVPVDDAGTRLAARAARRLELPHNPVAAVEATRNKALLRERLAQAGLASPSYRVVPFATDPIVLPAGLDFPVVVKPLSLSASRGVIRADTPAELADAVERVRRILNQPECAIEAGALNDRLLVEGYIPGVEVSIEGLLTNGRLHVLAIFDKPDPLEGPFFEETIYVTPSRLSEADQGRLAEATERAAAALGLIDGPLHAELRLNDAGVFPIDIAARSIGGLCSRTLSFGTGMTLEELILRHAIGADIPSFERESHAAGVMMIPIKTKGVLHSVEGLETAKAVPLVESITITIHLGGEVVPLPEGSAYLGFIFARGASPSAVEQALREAHSRLRFAID